jgi:hypothetical protein
MRKFAGVSIMLLWCAAAMAADFTGTWKLNLQKSKVGPPAAIAAYTLTIEKTGPNSYSTTVDITLTSGKKTHRVFNRVYDGQGHQEPAISGSDAEGSANASEICEFLPGGGRRITFKTDGKIVQTITSTLSADGQTLTNVESNAKGENTDTLIFDREK